MLGRIFKLNKFCKLKNKLLLKSFPFLKLNNSKSIVCDFMIVEKFSKLEIKIFCEF